MNSWETYADFMVDTGIITEDELALACSLCGTNVETLQKVLFIRTGYRSLGQFIEENC
jgi:hypothetical protein